MSVKVDGDYFLFKGHSGSVYRCHKKAYGIRSGYNCSVLADYKAKGKEKFTPLTKMPEVMKMDWGSK